LRDDMVGYRSRRSNHLASMSPRVFTSPLCPTCCDDSSLERSLHRRTNVSLSPLPFSPAANWDTVWEPLTRVELLPPSDVLTSGWKERNADANQGVPIPDLRQARRPSPLWREASGRECTRARSSSPCWEDRQYNWRQFFDLSCRPGALRQCSRKENLWRDVLSPAGCSTRVPSLNTSRSARSTSPRLVSTSFSAQLGSHDTQSRSSPASSLLLRSMVPVATPQGHSELQGVFADLEHQRSPARVVSDSLYDSSMDLSPGPCGGLSPWRNKEPTPRSISPRARSPFNSLRSPVELGSFHSVRPHSPMSGLRLRPVSPMAVGVEGRARQAHDMQCVLHVMQRQAERDVRVEAAKGTISTAISLEDLFSELDTSHKGYLTDTDLWNFSQDIGASTPLRSISALVSELQMLLGGDRILAVGHLSMRELGLLIFPAPSKEHELALTSFSVGALRSLQQGLDSCSGVPKSVRHQFQHLLDLAARSADLLRGDRQQLHHLLDSGALNDAFCSIAKGQSFSVEDLQRAFDQYGIVVNATEMEMMRRRYMDSRSSCSWSEFSRQLQPRSVL